MQYLIDVQVGLTEGVTDAGIHALTDRGCGAKLTSLTLWGGCFDVLWGPPFFCSVAWLRTASIFTLRVCMLVCAKVCDYAPLIWFSLVSLCVNVLVCVCVCV